MFQEDLDSASPTVHSPSRLSLPHCNHSLVSLPFSCSMLSFHPTLGPLLSYHRFFFRFLPSTPLHALASKRPFKRERLGHDRVFAFFPTPYSSILFLFPFFATSYFSILFLSLFLLLHFPFQPHPLLFYHRFFLRFPLHPNPLIRSQITLRKRTLLTTPDFSPFFSYFLFFHPFSLPNFLIYFSLVQTSVCTYSSQFPSISSCFPSPVHDKNGTVNWFHLIFIFFYFSQQNIKIPTKKKEFSFLEF